jgi:hypothetical protein
MVEATPSTKMRFDPIVRPHATGGKTCTTFQTDVWTFQTLHSRRVFELAGVTDGKFESLFTLKGGEAGHQEDMVTTREV